MKLSDLKKVIPVVLFFLVTFIIFTSNQLAQERQLIRESENKRIALVIGNGNYGAARSLLNPVNDATDMSNALKDLGFDVILGTDLSLKEMIDKVREFGDKIKYSGGTGLFYYAGHGIQVGGRNYLIPVEADIPREDEVAFAALNIDLVLQKLATANNGLNIVILDACRNNPFSRNWNRSIDDGGLAQVSAPTGTFIAYATSPDKTASDGSGRNGLYTSELLKVIRQPDLKIEEAFKQVTIAVDRASSGNQVPWTSSSLRGEFFFNYKGLTAKVTFEATVTNKPSDKELESTNQNVQKPNAADLAAVVETAEWNRIKNSSNPDDFLVFMQKYPRSIYTSQATSRIVALSTSSQVSPYGDGMASPASVSLIEGTGRIQMKMALTKQDFDNNMGVMGIGASFKQLTTLNGSRSQLRVSSGKPEFEFVYSGNINISDVVSLVKLKPKSDRREIQTMQKTFSGFSKDSIVSSVIEEVTNVAGTAGAGKTYRIKVSGTLSQGEYAIVISHATASFAGLGGLQGNTSFFDFGVDGGK